MKKIIPAILLLSSLTGVAQEKRTDLLPENTNAASTRGVLPLSQTSKPGDIVLKWQEKATVKHSDRLSYTYISFEGAVHNTENDHLPAFFMRQPVPGKAASAVTAQLVNTRFAPFSAEELKDIKGLNNIKETIEVTAAIAYERKEPYAQVSFIPIRYNKTTGLYEKLISFGLKFSYGTGAQARSTRAASDYAATSVLASGEWYKIGVAKDGIYKIDYNSLKTLGVDVSAIIPSKISLFGNPSGMLTEANAAPAPDDLTEYAITISGENDGVFDSTDYILFYGQGPHRPVYNSTTQLFEHSQHLYSDTAYYFLSINQGNGRRIPAQSPSTAAANVTVTSFDDFAWHEKELINLIKSGRKNFGESFDAVTSRTFSFSFPDIDAPYPVTIKAEVAARAGITSTFTISSGAASATISVPNVNLGDYQGRYAAGAGGTMQFTPASNNVDITLTYNKPSNAMGWLNFIEANARRKLKMAGNQMPFRDRQSVGAGNISEFIVGNGSAVNIWEVTSPQNVSSVGAALSGGSLIFRVSTDSLREFIAFNGMEFYTPSLIGKIENQNLHGLPQTGMIIVTHPLFKAQAEDLAVFHRQEGLTVEVATTEQVYNEFSSGSVDLCAIRNFMRMFYERASTPEEMPKYLLLYGDGSYDNRNRTSSNTAFIPTYQSPESFNVGQSYVSDDFFGFLDVNEGNWGSIDNIDIGIGRLPVKNTEEAKNVLNKIKSYASSSTMKNWRNIVCFVGDDEDGNTHTTQANDLATLIDNNHRAYNVEKIYFDAYKQQSTAGGQRFPDVNDAINRRVEKGALIINYTGHGGEMGWAHEGVLTVPQINGWKNINNLPLFFTATCEFSRFDDPGRTSAGEYVLLNKEGGGIALFTTVRLVYSTPNYTLNNNFYQRVFNEVNGEMPRMGDTFRETKNASSGDSNARNFSLLGDPALRLAYPRESVTTSTINSKAVAAETDTIKSLSKVTVTGHLTNKNGEKLTDFNGIIYPTVYDKKSNLTTLQNDADSPQFNFSLWKNIIYRGKASVKNGDFTFTFIVPKDIAYNYGIGRISYYAENGSVDAHGYCESFVIGGTADSAALDNAGPDASVYMNDRKFAFGGITDENPNLVGYLFDENGINTVGSGIGHDLTAVLDGNTDKTIVLNDYYEADLDSYQSGTVKYPFSELSEGRHNLKLKVWDVYNNSSEAYTEFIVAKSAELALEHVLNYPNPFTTHTEFYFEHNQPGARLDVQVQVFTVSGKLVKTIDANINTEGYRAEPIPWNGRDDYGDKIGRGVYVYRVKVKSPDGSHAEKYEKLVILN